MREIIHFCRVFSCVLMLLCNVAGLQRRDTENEEPFEMSGLWRGEHRVQKNPAHLTSHSTHVTRQPISLCPQELYAQAWLQNLNVLADGYEADVSVMMERIRKTRKHSVFYHTHKHALTHTHTSPPLYNFFESFPVHQSWRLSFFQSA